MKTILHLKQNSHFFIGNLNLQKHAPKEVEYASLSDTQINILNRYIRSGAVHSSEGYIPLPTPMVAPMVEETSIAEIAPEVLIEPVVQTIEELLPITSEEVISEIPVEVTPEEVGAEITVEDNSEILVVKPKKTTTKKEA
jgi:hypothetical protein